jgi:phospholipase D1/2
MQFANFKRWLPALLLGLALLAALIAAHVAGVTIPAALRWIYHAVKDAPWLLLALCALRPPFILPISWPVLLCGAVWGLWPGGAYAVAGMLLSAASSYVIARFIVPAHNDAAPPASKFDRWLQRLRHEGFMAVVLMRLMLLPFDMVNYAAAALQVKLRSFMLATVIGNTAATLIYSSIGASIRLDAILAGNEPPLRELFNGRQLLVTLALLALSLLIAYVVKKRSGAALAQ